MTGTMRTRPAAEDIDRLRRRIRSYILRMVRDPAEADDLTQETFLRAHRSLASLRDDAALAAWLYRIATHVCYDRFRQASRLPPHEPLAEADEAGVASAPRLDEILARSEMSSCVQESLATLPDGYRSVILLHDVHGLTAREIADMQSCTVETAKIRLHRARARLRAALAQACHLSYDERNALVCGRKEPSTRPGRPRSRTYGRGVLRGIGQYVQTHGRWKVYHTERKLSEAAPQIKTAGKSPAVQAVRRCKKCYPPFSTVPPAALCASGCGMAMTL